ncbi:[FeFe] hydrogenase H-cluster radical SAM maturase HydE [Helicovermis profundi]|uniref:[FeFe] hydrogenase H-cluster radical SAM maturase HydE n=1 Tax=Helicovermis profundi TaxID=3065157 RepID=A0AAU9EBF4_9FIRM|nr:[FeFe] hydrogenase H-cluster radical SAM maturase HydE [Clostridia bacterium S502]
MPTTEELIYKLYENENLSDNELLKLLDEIDIFSFTDKNRDLLFELSRKKRSIYYKDDVYMRGLIEFTNYCTNNCDYCGLRNKNINVDRYRLSKEQIIDCCKEGYKLGYRTFVLQGGEDNHFSDDVLVDLIISIKKLFSDVAITLSIGEKSKKSYQKYKNAGADRFLLRHETANKEIYENIHPNMSFENRINCLKTLKELGYQVGAGFMVGLPNQTNSVLVEDLRFLKDLDPEMIGIGPFIPHEDTPLGKFKGGSVEQTLILLAIIRLLLPQVLLPSTTAMGTLDKLGREKALKAGANVVMPNLSPTNVREKYEIYKDKICTGDEAAHCRGCIERRINSAGFKVNMSKGDYFSWDNINSQKNGGKNEQNTLVK